jgi:SNARE protein
LQTDQLGRITNDLDTIQFSIKKASKLVKEISRQLATDRCFMFLLFLVVAGAIAIIILKVVHPLKHKSTPPAPGRRLLLSLLDLDQSL